MGKADLGLGLGWTCWTAVQKGSGDWLPVQSRHELRSELYLPETLQTFCCTWSWAAAQHTCTQYSGQGKSKKTNYERYTGQIFCINYRSSHDGERLTLLLRGDTALLQSDTPLTWASMGARPGGGDGVFWV